MRRSRLLRWSKTGVVVGGVTASLIGLAVPAGAATGPVSTTPASQTPQLNATSTNEQIRQLVQCGGTMYAVGTFTSIKRNSTVFARNNIFSFSATSPFLVSSWNPNVNGIVNSIAFNGSNCADAYIGGKFTTVGSTTVKNIAEIDTTTGAVVTAFGHSASSQVQTLQGYNGHILVGGYYTSINNSTADPYMTSLNPTTGKDDGFIHLGISGNYNYAPNNATRVYNQQLSNGGTLDLVEGDFTSVGGLQREQIFMLNLAGTTATVTPWTSPQFDGSQPQATSAFQCATVEPFYIQAAAWSPDDSTIYMASTGYHPNGFSTGQGASHPRTGLCDSAAAFPSTQASVQSLWINYTGCDSLYSVAADSSAAYFGGHQRWTENPEGCDQAGPGAIADPGLEALSPTTGLVTSNPPVYTRARGLGADDMLLTSAGLWIASDNMSNASQCDGVFGHAGICFLPYS